MTPQTIIGIVMGITVGPTKTRDSILNVHVQPYGWSSAGSSPPAFCGGSSNGRGSAQHLPLSHRHKILYIRLAQVPFAVEQIRCTGTSHFPRRSISAAPLSAGRIDHPLQGQRHALFICIKLTMAHLCITFLAFLGLTVLSFDILQLGKMRSILTSALAGLAFAGTALSQACQTTTLQTSVPSNGSEVALQSFSYCGGTFNATAYIANLDYGKTVTLYYTNAQGQSTPLSSLTFGYSSSIGNGSWELWTTRYEHHLNHCQMSFAKSSAPFTVLKSILMVLPSF